MPGPLRLLTRRAGPLGLALTAWDIWRRLPPKQRKKIMQATRKHGPRVVKEVAKRRGDLKKR
ncbi:MAG: hypothetical protein QOE36_500 [Gaiellaceae bacterium]|nr:hypothetical protein [Gaiellaceae bacterium]